MSGEPYVTIRVERKRSLPDYGHETISITVGQVPEHASDDYRRRLYDKAESIVQDLREIIEERFHDAKPRPLVPPINAAPIKENPLLKSAPASNPLLTAAPPAESGRDTSPEKLEKLVDAMLSEGGEVTDRVVDRTVVALADIDPTIQPVKSEPTPPASDPDDIVPLQDDGPIQFGKDLVTFGHPYSGYEFENHEGHEKVVHEAHRLRALNSLLNRSGFTDYRYRFARLVTGRTIDSLNELSIREAEVMYDFLLHASDDQKKQALSVARK